MSITLFFETLQSLIDLPEVIKNVGEASLSLLGLLIVFALFVWISRFILKQFSIPWDYTYKTQGGIIANQQTQNDRLVTALEGLTETFKTFNSNSIAQHEETRRLHSRNSIIILGQLNNLEEILMTFMTEAELVDYLNKKERRSQKTASILQSYDVSPSGPDVI
jgi:hypothetical protein